MYAIMKRIIFSNLDVMYQKSCFNHRKNKQACFPTPQTRIQQRHSQSQQNWICLQHSSPLQLICLHCQNKVLCSQCVQLPVHSSHEIKSMERARQMIYSQYQQSMVRLSSKSEILDIIHVQFQANKSEINSFSKHYKEKLTNQFSQIIACFEAKLDELLGSIDGFIRQYIFQMSSNMERIRSKRKQIEKILMRYDKEHIDSVSLPQLANYSYEMRRKVHDLLDDHDITLYKEKLVDPEWRVNNEAFDDIKHTIDSISLNFKHTNKFTQIEEEKPKKKQRKDIKIHQYHERQRSENKLKNSASSNPFISTLTPKNKSKQKKIKQKKSPQMQILRKRKKSSAKMISMPASPAKEVESTYLATPQLSRKKLFKKK